MLSEINGLPTTLMRRVGMGRLTIVPLVALQCLASSSGFAQPAKPRPTTEQRLALVIGNGAYKESPLTNPLNDARDIAATLGEVGFKVMRLENADRTQMVKAVREFGDRLQQGGVGLFYFAGHGMQVKGRNFLIPVGAEIEREDEVAYQSIDANQVLEKMESARNRLNIVILDACRNNPFARSFRSTAQGLAQMEAPVGTLVAFSTAPGSVASDGSGRNGLYTQHLLRNIKEPGLKIEDVFKRVRLSVRLESEGKQVPWESTSLEGDFFFRTRPASAVKPPAEPGTGVAFARPSPGAPKRAERPVLVKGDEWTYIFRNLNEGSARQVRLVVAEVSSNEVLLTNGDRYGPDGETLFLKGEGRSFEPGFPRLVFPMTAGREKKGSYKIIGDKKFPEWTVNYILHVMGLEQVTVPAGTFDTFKLELFGTYQVTGVDGRSGKGTFRQVRWYSPIVKREVLRDIEGTNIAGAVDTHQRIELTAFSVR